MLLWIECMRQSREIEQQSWSRFCMLLKLIFTGVKIVLSKADMRISGKAVVVFQSTHQLLFSKLFPFHLHSRRTQLLDVFAAYAVYLLILLVQELVYLFILNPNFFGILFFFQLFFERNLTIFKFRTLKLDFCYVVRLVGISGHWCWLQLLSYGLIICLTIRLVLLGDHVASSHGWFNAFAKNSMTIILLARISLGLKIHTLVFFSPEMVFPLGWRHRFPQKDRAAIFGKAIDFVIIIELCISVKLVE